MLRAALSLLEHLLYCVHVQQQIAELAAWYKVVVTHAYVVSQVN